MRRLLASIQHYASRLIPTFDYHRVSSDDPVTDIDLELAPLQPAVKTNVLRDVAGLMLTRENIPSISFALVLTFTGIVLNFLGPYLLGKTITSLRDNEDAEFLGEKFSLSSMVVMLFLAHTLAQIVPIIRDKALVSVGATTTQRLLTNITEHLLRKTLHDHVNTTLAKKMYLVQKGFPVANISIPLLTQIIPTFLEIGFAILMLSSQYGAGMGIGMASTLLLYTGYSAATAGSIVHSRERMLHSGNAAWGEINGAIKNYKSIHDFDLLANVLKSVEESTIKAADAEKMAKNTPLNISVGHVFIARFSSLLVALYIGRGVAGGQYALQEFIAIIAYLNKLSTLIPAFGSSVNEIFAAIPDMKFVFGQLQTPSKVVDDYPYVEMKIVKPTIEFKGVAFSYPPRPGEAINAPVLHNLDLLIKSGQTVALVSKSGGGKSTIYNLLFRYYMPTKGNIYIDGVDIFSVSLRSLRKNIGLIGQSPNLSPGTIRENILNGCANAHEMTDEDIMRMARILGFEELIDSFAKGLNTDIGVDGLTLSGGQRQRIAILRGMLKPCKIRLFDEITASLDANSAAAVMKGIRQITAQEGNTSLMVTHKLLEAQHVDQIAVLDQGGIVDVGTHSELLQRCPLYQALWSQQQDKTCACGDEKAIVFNGRNGLFAADGRQQGVSEVVVTADLDISIAM